jgi:hypothetical protein
MSNETTLSLMNAKKSDERNITLNPTYKGSLAYNNNSNNNNNNVSEELQKYTDFKKSS